MTTKKEVDIAWCISWMANQSAPLTRGRTVFFVSLMKEGCQYGFARRTQELACDARKDLKPELTFHDLGEGDIPPRWWWWSSRTVPSEIDRVDQAVEA